MRARSLMRSWLGLPDDAPMYDVLKGVDLSVAEGRLIGILGHNGAGKSTLLRVLAGVYPPDGGAVEINGDIASLFELGGTGNTQLTGRSFARGYLGVIGVLRRQMDALIAEIHDFSELDDYFDQKIATYSSGMAARLYFAVATAIQRDVYLIDEILAVGDEHFQVKSQVRMRERLTKGASGVLVTHDWASVIRLCREASILANGQLSDPAPADKAIARYLDLSPPSSQFARLIVQEVYQVASEGPLTLSFGVEVETDEGAEIAVSIDAMEPGIGWESVVLTEFLPVPRQRGRHYVTLMLPYVPLRPGQYALGIFLTTQADTVGVRTSFDARTWTYGNGVPLFVEGPARTDLAPFPITWSQVSN